MHRFRLRVALADAIHELVLGLLNASVPVVVALHGWVAGAGVWIAAAGDVVVASRCVRFFPVYGSIGLSPDGGMSWVLPRLMGPARALDLLLTDGMFTASEARRIGLVSRIVDDSRGEAERVAALLAEGPTRVLARTKRLVRDGAHRELVPEHEVTNVAECPEA